MKFGALTFSYRSFGHFRDSMASAGHYSVNIGDAMQSIATRALYRQLGIADADMIGIDRDSLPHYKGPPAWLVMNGVFMPHCFPLPPQIEPIFTGFRAGMRVINENLDLLRRHQPIGCRDPNTAQLLAKRGIRAEVTGCITLTLPARDPSVVGDRVFVVAGSGEGKLPEGLLAAMPRELLARVEFVHQRLTVFEHPLSPAWVRGAERLAEHLLETYRTRASLIVTPLHHAATPGLASGIRVVLCREDDSPRFGHVASLIPLYGPDRFHAIDWEAKLPDLGPTRARILELVRQRIAGGVQPAG